jgi:hypothetical protein
MRKGRKHYTGEEKVAILRRHLLDKVPVSDLRAFRATMARSRGSPRRASQTYSLCARLCAPQFVAGYIQV